MSVVSREALIDARQLPKAPNQRFQDIYLFVMPRNMPQTIPGGATDGVLYVRRQALSRAEVVAAPYIQAMQQNSGDKIRDAILKLGRRPGAGAAAVGPRSAVEQPPDPQDFPDRIARIENALDIMAQRDFERTTALLQIVKTRKVTAADLNEAVVRAVGPEEAAGIVPTLEIYPFYRPLGVGPALLPMTAFTVFLSHDGTMTGRRSARTSITSRSRRATRARSRSAPRRSRVMRCRRPTRTGRAPVAARDAAAPAATAAW